jgi:hypothetical protein
VLKLGDWAEIRRLHRGEQMPIKVIARAMGRVTRCAGLRVPMHHPPTNAFSSGSIVDEVGARIRERLQACLPTLPLAAHTNLASSPSDLWFPDFDLPLGAGQNGRAPKTPVLVMAQGHSRWISALMIPSRRAEDLFTATGN